MHTSKLLPISAALFLAVLLTGSASADDFCIRVGVSSGRHYRPSTHRVYYRSAPRTYYSTRTYYAPPPPPPVARVYYTPAPTVYYSEPVTRVYSSPAPVVVYREPRPTYVRYESYRSYRPVYTTSHRTYHYRGGYSGSCGRDYVRPHYDSGRRASLRFYYND
ncbi:MAG: hypothetical protein JXO22_08975 [Phycisphaerae bacterium]|nr:hypothetical protein [Phycisphaerae bacterium]